MKFAGIIAEYDPFHNGHAWQLAQARALGAQRVAVAMSCGLTQRGALPLLPEAVRVQAALACGADLVFALPAPCACAGAEAFARAGVRILAAAGCDALVFGAENPDTALLQKAARVLCSEAYRTALKQQLAAGARSFAAARQAAVQALCPGSDVAALLDKPNNNLAVEYCKAIIEQNVEMQPIALPRQGADHGQALTESSHTAFASASALRALWAEGGAAALAPYVPEKALKLYKQAEYDGKYTDHGALRAGTAAGSLRRASPLCRGARGIRRLGAPAGKRRAGDRKPARFAGCPDHRALPPGADAAAGDGCGAGLHRPDPGAAALSAPAGRTQGGSVPARGDGAAAVPLAGAAGTGKRDLRPNGCCPEQSQRPWCAVPDKTGADGRDISSKNYLFDELTKNNAKNFILCPLVSGAVRVYD